MPLLVAKPTEIVSPLAKPLELVILGLFPEPAQRAFLCAHERTVDSLVFCFCRNIPVVIRDPPGLLVRGVEDWIARIAAAFLRHGRGILARRPGGRRKTWSVPEDLKTRFSSSA